MMRDGVAIERTLRTELKLYYDLQTSNRSPSPLLIALHGYGASKRQMLREAQQMAPTGFAIVAPQGIHQHLKEPKEPDGPLRFGFGWLTNFHPEESVGVHHQVLLDLIATLVDEGVANREQIFLLGFSQSCALNYRFAFTHAELLRGVIGICGGLPGDWENSDLYKPSDAAVLHLAGSKDEFYGPSRVSDYADRLRVRARNTEFKSYEAGHEIVPEMRNDVCEWLGRHSK